MPNSHRGKRNTRSFCLVVRLRFAVESQLVPTKTQLMTPSLLDMLCIRFTKKKRFTHPALSDLMARGSADSNSRDMGPHHPLKIRFSPTGRLELVWWLRMGFPFALGKSYGPVQIPIQTTLRRRECSLSPRWVTIDQLPLH